MEKIASGIFSLLLGSVGLWTGLRQLKNRHVLTNWKTVPGKVIERGTYRPKIASLSASAFRYSPLVKYSYQVNGADFINDAIHPRRIQLPKHSSKKWAQKQAETFPGEVLVHYNSDDPGESYLVLTSKLVLAIVVALGGIVDIDWFICFIDLSWLIQKSSMKARSEILSSAVRVIRKKRDPFSNVTW